MNDVLRSLELERQVLAGLLNRDNFFRVELVPDDFSAQENRRIFSAIERRAKAGKELDLSLVVEDMREHGELLEHGEPGDGCPISYVLRTLENAFCSISLSEGAAKLREYAIRRKLKDYSTFTLQRAGDLETSVEDVLSDAQRDILAISSGQISGATLSSQYNSYFSRKSDILRGRVYKIPTGFDSLDKLLDGGLENGQFVVIPARPSMGKTAFGLRIAAQMARKGRRVLFMSLEQTFDKIVDRLIAAEGVIKSSALQSKEGLQEVWDRYRETLELVKRLPIEIDARASATVAHIAAKARKMQADGKLDAVVIDYLQLIKGRAGLKPNTPREQVVAGVADDLFALAHSLNVPVIALAQTNRATDSRQDKRPILADIRETDRIAMNADIVIALHRDEYYMRDETPAHKKGVADVLILKNRDGRVGTCYLGFLPEYVTFAELPPERLMLVSGRTLTSKEAARVNALAKGG